MATDPGFVKGQSDNLPRIDSFTMFSFLGRNPDFVGAEIRGVKMERSGRESYGNNAIGYVQVKRDGQVCIVKARVSPEHNVRKKAYSVTLICDEAEDEIESIKCEDCAASLGGCKHAIALLTWLHRRSEEPSCTSTVCYWKRSALSKVGTVTKFIKAAEMGKPPQTTSTSAEKKSMLLSMVKNETRKNCGFDTNLSKYWQSKSDIQKLSIHYLAGEFFRTKNGNTPQHFLNFCMTYVNEGVCLKALSETNGQVENILWNELRYARITASKVYEVAHCKTVDGVLVERIFGAKVSKDTPAMQRGQNLEKLVRKEIEKTRHIKLDTCGLIIDHNNPVIGASADGLNDKFAVEIKCPSMDKTIKNYISDDNKIKERYFAQLQMQMYLHKKQKGIFCVASPQFESNKSIQIIEVDLDEGYCKGLIDKAMKFWGKAIFPVIKRNFM